MASANISKSQVNALFLLDYVNEEEENGIEEGKKGGEENCPVCGKVYKRIRMHCFSQHKDY
jgi:hypothetical protein